MGLPRHCHLHLLPRCRLFFSPIPKVTDRYAIGRGDFALGRIAAVDAKTIVKPRWILTIFVSGVINFIAPPMGAHGERGVAVLYLVPLFKSNVFPTIFTISIRSLGRHTKRGSPWIVASVSGGALLPAIIGLVADHKIYITSPCRFR